MTYLTRRYDLTLAHRIPADYVGEAVAGVHGHGFKLDVTLAGEPHAVTGEVCDRARLDELVKEKILSRFDRSLINDHLEFGTGEVISAELLKILKGTPGGENVVSIQLVETRKNRFQGLLKNS